MDWLSRSWCQTAEWFRALPPNLRVASILAAVVLVATVALFSRLDPETDYVPLFEDASFSSAEVIQMTAALRKAGLNDSRMDGRRILVPTSDLEDYLVALHKAGSLPSDFDEAPVATPSFNPFASREHLQQSQLEADKRKLERILASMSGIETASVQYTHVKKPGFPPTEETRAVVAVRVADGQHLRLEEVDALRNTAVAYVAGLDHHDVTITDLNACRAYSGDDAAVLDSYAVTAMTRMWETDLQTKIERQLSMVPDVIVGVTAHFDEIADGDSAPGQEPSKTQPVLVTASISIPDNYYSQVWRQRNPAADTKPADGDLQSLEREVAQMVERAVLAILPPPAVGWEADKRVEVTTYDALASIADLEPTKTPSPWTSFSSFIGLLLALGTAAVVWWMLARREAAPAHAVPPTSQPAPQMSANPTEPHSPAAPKLQTELRQAIEQDPDAAAKLLSQWLRDAA